MEGWIIGLLDGGLLPKTEAGRDGALRRHRSLRSGLHPSRPRREKRGPPHAKVAMAAKKEHPQKPLPAKSRLDAERHG
jgi:hypothetical protein